MSATANGGTLRAMGSPTRVRARYEDGVFKPLVSVELPERTEVELTVVDRRAFDAWWRGHTERMRARVGDIPSAELDADVDAAISEARQKPARRT